MRALMHLASRLYPAAWRKRYGVEFQLLLEDMTPRWRDVVDVLIGGSIDPTNRQRRSIREGSHAQVSAGLVEERCSER